MYNNKVDAMLNRIFLSTIFSVFHGFIIQKSYFLSHFYEYGENL